MSISTKCPNCNRVLSIDEQCLGHTLQCPFCSKTFTLGGTNSTQGMSHAPTQSIKEYKVLTQKDKWFSGKFDPEKLESALNAYAKQGWRVVGCATASFPGLIANNREEIVIIMERG